MKLLVAVGRFRIAVCAPADGNLAASPMSRWPRVFPCGLQVWRHELGGEPNFPFRRYQVDDFTSPFASGSALWDAVVAIPCSVDAWRASLTAWATISSAEPRRGLEGTAQAGAGGARDPAVADPPGKHADSDTRRGCGIAGGTVVLFSAGHR